ncbi:hypothetical protein [Oceanobacillus locisalsi]|uniref:Uncharacterized protein n=1 Tax=Oceanobacillus locisalsi TaxID=546107 RepID=A0ABW3NFZ9_9BACI
MKISLFGQKKAKRKYALPTGGIRESLTIIVIPAVKKNKPEIKKKFLEFLFLLLNFHALE